MSAFRSFGEYKDTDDFLQLSQTNLKSVLGSDDIEVKELDVFLAALRWAEFQCKEMMVEPIKTHIREVLGDCLFEIRFPIMTCAEFTEARGSKDVFTADETIGIYGFISKRLEFDSMMLPFKTTPRKQEQTPNSKHTSETNSSEALMPPGILRLSLTRNCQSVENPSFVCNGSQEYHFFVCEKKITVYGLGFLGPIENDGFYDVKVQIVGAYGIEYDSGMLEKRIFAEKGKTFYFVFDAPIDLEEGDVIRNWTKFYRIDYYLKGANTSACSRALSTEIILQEKDTQFRLQYHSKQLAEILFISNN